MLVADEFFLLAHHDQTGRPRLSAKVCGLALAAGLLGELTLYGKVEARSGQLYVINARPPDDALAHTTLDQIVKEPLRHPVSAWLAYLAQTARESVARRLTFAGIVRRDVSRRVLRQQVNYVPADLNTAAAGWARLATGARRHERLAVPDSFVFGLASISGIDGLITAGQTNNAREYARMAVGGLPPPLRELLAHTEVAVGEAVLNYRT